MPTTANIIYGLVDPRTLMVRYVGQSTQGMRRPRLHQCESTLKGESHTPKSRWIRKMKRLGLVCEIVVLQETTRESIDGDERWWIAYGKACGWSLTNLQDGGRSLSKNARKKLAQASTGRIKSAETRKLLAMRMLGKKPSSETLEKIKEAQKRRRVREKEMGITYSHSDEARAKISAANKGRAPAEKTIAAALAARNGKPPWNRGKVGVFKHTADAVAKIAAASRARKMSAEAVAKSAAARRGAKRSDEAKAKMRAARLRFLSSPSSSGGV